MASENETVAEIAKMMRRNEEVFHHLYWCEYADCIEAAHQREVAELKRKMNDVVCENEALRDACGTCGAKREREATREKSSQVGNAAKIREMCEVFLEDIVKCKSHHTGICPAYSGEIVSYWNCPKDKPCAKAVIIKELRALLRAIAEEGVKDGK